jgi:Na+/melibiose symporter-like transporter
MYLAHIPINHHLRPLYRVLAVLAGLYLVGFGIVGFVKTAGLEFFARDDLPTFLGQKANPAASVFAVVLGAVIVLVTVVGRNWDHYGNFWIGQIMMLGGLAELAFLRTDANVLGFTMTNVIVTFVIAIVILTEALYGKVGDEGAVERERVFAERAAPQSH